MSAKYLVLFVIIFIKFTIHYYLIHPVYELHRDEFLHLDQANHPAWGYLSVPPASAVISKLILLLGGSEFWVRFFPALFGALTILVVWKTVEELKGSLFAMIMASAAVMFSVVMRMNMLWQPNSLDILMWTCVFYAAIKFISSEKPVWLYTLSIAWAVGFLNKYNIGFLLPGLLLALLISPLRNWFLNKHFWFSSGLAFILILPNLIWQYNNDFPVFRHLNELAETQLQNVSRKEFMTDQILFFIGSIYVLIAAFVSFFRYTPFKSYRLLIWCFIFVMAVFVLLRAKSYYAVGLYPVFFAFGAVWIDKLITGRFRIYLLSSGILLPVLVFFLLMPIAFPLKSPGEIMQNPEPFEALGLMQWEDGKDHHLPQDFADMLGWKELAAKVDSAFMLAQVHGNILVLCDNYGQAGAINYYSEVKSMSAVSFSADYINWFPVNKDIDVIILIKDMTDSDPERLNSKAHFNSVSLFGEITNPAAREFGTRIFILSDSQKKLNHKSKDYKEALTVL